MAMRCVHANVATVGPYKLKVINSLVHGGAYVAVHLGNKRVAWVSFKTKAVQPYQKTTREDLKEIALVHDWFEDNEHYNLAARLWNDFKNGVTVSLLKGEHDGT